MAFTATANPGTGSVRLEVTEGGVSRITRTDRNGVTVWTSDQLQQTPTRTDLVWEDWTAALAGTITYTVYRQASPSNKWEHATVTLERPGAPARLGVLGRHTSDRVVALVPQPYWHTVDTITGLTSSTDDLATTYSIMGTGQPAVVITPAPARSGTLAMWARDGRYAQQLATALEAEPIRWIRTPEPDMLDMGVALSQIALQPDGYAWAITARYVGLGMVPAPVAGAYTAPTLASIAADVRASDLDELSTNRRDLAQVQGVPL